MARRVEIFEVTVPAGTQIAAPQVTFVRFDEGTVEVIEIRVPPGPSGRVGFGIMHGGASVLPREESRWVITDDEKIVWPVQNLPEAGDWRIRMYNLGVFDHTIEFRFLVAEVERDRGVALPSMVLRQPNQVAIASTEAGFPQGVTG